MIAPDCVRIRDLLQLLLEDYNVRGVAQAYIAALKVKSILNPETRGHQGRKADDGAG
jgi:hypothetical protein